MKQKRMIWSNDIDTIEALVENMKSDGWYDDTYETEDEWWEAACDLNNDYLDDERMNLNVQTGNEIILIGTVGRWNGTFSGYQIIDSGNIRDCFTSECDYCTWYCDRYNMRYEGIHHDGRNRGMYRVFRDGLTEEQKEHFLDAIYYGKCNDRMIRRYTESVKPYVAAVYGW